VLSKCIHSTLDASRYSTDAPFYKRRHAPVRGRRCGDKRIGASAK